MSAPTTAPEPSSASPSSGVARGVVIGVVSAAAFGTSGSFAKSLLDAGWSPGAAVTVRIAVAGVLLLGPACWSLRGRWSTLRAAAPLVVVFGVLAVAGCQLFYFNAVRTLSVGVALLLEYLGLVLVVGWRWLVDHERPGRATLVGVLLAVVGLVLVLDVFGGGIAVDVGGVLWGLGAAVGLAAYFLIAAHDHSGVPPIALAGGGMLVGAVTLAVAGAIGVMPMAWSRADVVMAGHDVAWWVPVLGLAAVAGAFAYGTGVASSRLLGSKLAAFLGLTEVLFAVLFAWVVLDEVPRAIQALGGVLILVGVAVVRYEAAVAEDAADDAEADPAVGSAPEPTGPAPREDAR